MKGRRPCIHGDLCRGIYKLTGRIYSVRCPYGCKFYEPVKVIKKGGAEWLSLLNGWYNSTRLTRCAKPLNFQQKKEKNW